MTPEEREMLVRIDERTLAWKEDHDNCPTRVMVQTHETKIQRAEGAILLLLALVSIGSIYDLYEFIKQLLI
jgi:hypothetical protein